MAKPVVRPVLLSVEDRTTICNALLLQCEQVDAALATMHTRHPEADVCDRFRAFLDSTRNLQRRLSL